MADTFKGIITADGKKRQLPYGSVLETPVSDETLSIQGAFADAKVVGNNFKKTKAEIDSLKEDIGELNDFVGSFSTLYRNNGSDFNNLKPLSKIKWNSETDSRVMSYYKNMFPCIADVGIQGFSASLSNITAVKDKLSATVKAGEKFKQITSKPIFLKAGTYMCGSSFKLLSGSATGNIGFIYISLCDKDGNITHNQYSSIQLSMDKQSSVTKLILNSDTYLVFMFYANINGTVLIDSAIEWYNIFVNKENISTGYSSFVGDVQHGVGGLLNNFDGINIISDNSIEILYLQSEENLKEEKIVCWGDSLTQGTGSDRGKPSSDVNKDTSYPSILSRMLNKPVINLGVGGEPSWMISARSGHNEICAEPFTIPAEITAVRIYLHGQEQDYFWDNTVNAWTYLKDNLSYNIAVDDVHSGVNPVSIGGIEGKITRTLISSGQSDPDTGETVQGSTFAYYFTRKENGEEKTLVCRTPIITNAYKEFDNAIKIIWMGQNDAPLHDGKYITQGSAKDRAKSMCNEKHIVISLPTGTSSGNAVREQEFYAEFGANYLNIRDYICKNGIAYANSIGANITPSEDDKALIEKGTIPSCLRSDSVHGNYWYYQIVAKAVYDKGKALGYWY